MRKNIIKLRKLSDLHLDINKGLPFRIKDKEIFTIICGDTSGYFSKTVKWLENNVKNGIFVAGNHILYNKGGHSLQYQLKQYEKKYPLSSPVSFLNDSYKIVGDIVFVGGTLWTDYCLFGAERKDFCKWYAFRNMNDFKYGKTNFETDIENEKKNQKIKLRPEDCEKMFFNTLSYIDGVCSCFVDKKIVVVTHHAPSEKSISPIYKNDFLNPAFASNLENFILEHPNIKLWCHGYIHWASNYKIGGCRVICNPRGYERYNELAKYTGFNKDLLIDI